MLGLARIPLSLALAAACIAPAVGSCPPAADPAGGPPARDGASPARSLDAGAPACSDRPLLRLSRRTRPTTSLAEVMPAPIEDPGGGDGGGDPVGPVCNNGICEGNEAATCPNDCRLACTGMDLNPPDPGACPGAAAGPPGGGNCACVVRIRTRDRSVTGNSLFQECYGHWGHGICPATCNSDFPHSAPTGNWGAHVGAAQVLGSPLLQPAVSDRSVIQDGSQWPGHILGSCACGPCLLWNTCTCDTQHPNDGSFAPNATSPGPAEAGSFRVTSASPDCSALRTGSMQLSIRLDLYELDAVFGSDDLVGSIPRTITVGGFSCTGSDGRCSGTAPGLPFRIAAGRDGVTLGAVEATGEIVVECAGRPFPDCQPECGVSVECGQDACGNDCGGCGLNEVCSGGLCVPVCAPCLGLECGWDMSCGPTWCGSCPEGFGCSGFGTCEPVCTPCAGQTCGWDLNCFSSTWCGDCLEGFECNAQGTCEDVSSRLCFCGDGVCCTSETDPSLPGYCPGDCFGTGGGGGGGGCSCDCDADGFVSADECVGGCGGYIDGPYCVIMM